MPERCFYVYILANESRTLYIGVTNKLERRFSEHKQKFVAGFTAKYNISRLVYSAEFNVPREAIAYEKKLKGWSRAKKVALVEADNSTWKDLAADWFNAVDEESKPDI